MNKTQLVKSTSGTRGVVGNGLAGEYLTLSQLVETFPRYYIIKSKTSLPVDFAVRLKRFEKEAPQLLGKVKIDHRDGLSFDFSNSRLQIRQSDTEPVYRLLIETRTQNSTDSLHG